MWSGLEAHIYIPLLIFVFAFGYYLNRIDQRVKAIKNQLGRLSLTFLKIETDLSAIQDSLLIMSCSDEEIKSKVQKIKDRRSKVFERIVIEGPNLGEILRGLELPDIDDDPAFWREDRLKKLGVAVSETSEVEEGK